MPTLSSLATTYNATRDDNFVVPGGIVGCRYDTRSVASDDKVGIMTPVSVQFSHGGWSKVASFNMVGGTGSSLNHHSDYTTASTYYYGIEMQRVNQIAKTHRSMSNRYRHRSKEGYQHPWYWLSQNIPVWAPLQLIHKGWQRNVNITYITEMC